MSISIRKYQGKDFTKIIALTPRLSDFELLEFRQKDQIDQTNLEMVEKALAETEDEDNVIYVAEDAGVVVGYLRLQTQSDYFSGEQHGYIANLAVAQSQEGRGVGRMLLDQAEAWTQEKGYDRLKLHVFVENRRAAQIYEKFGYEQDVIQYVKRLG
jgi:ribosomal protein S18 acetylase RimI-like enzyme